jgi:hypothetical protein
MNSLLLFFNAGESQVTDFDKSEVLFTSTVTVETQVRVLYKIGLQQK